MVQQYDEHECEETWIGAKKNPTGLRKTEMVEEKPNYSKRHRTREGENCIDPRKLTQMQEKTSSSRQNQISPRKTGLIEEKSNSTPTW